MFFSNHGLLGEGVDDHGGPYSQLFADICVELQSDVLPLLVPSPNQVGAVGKHQEKFIINPLVHSVRLLPSPPLSVFPSSSWFLSVLSDF